VLLPAERVSVPACTFTVAFCCCIGTVMVKLLVVVLFSVPVFTKLLVPVLLDQPPKRTSAVPLFCKLAPLK
jgi:hypothetical protein